MVKLKEFKDFRNTPYYKYYEKRIDEYCMIIINNILKTQWTDNNKIYNYNDVMKEVLKFVNGDLRQFKDDLDINPNQEDKEKQEADKFIEEQAKLLLNNGM